MLNNVLVPLDGSVAAEQAVTHALQLAAQTSAQVILLHVTPARIEQAEYASMFGQAHEYVKSLSNCYVASGNQATTVLRRGDPVTEILLEVNEALVDLVVMSTHGCANPPLGIMGGIPYTLLNRLLVPVLLVPPESKPRYNRITLVLDSASYAPGTLPAIEHLGQVFRFISNLARGTNSKVTLFQAAHIEDNAIGELDPSASHADMQIYNEHLPAIVEDGLACLAQELRLQSIDTEIIYAEGEVNTALQCRLQDAPADLVILAAQRQSIYSRHIVDMSLQIALHTCRIPALVYPLHPYTLQPVAHEAIHLAGR